MKVIQSPATSIIITVFIAVLAMPLYTNGHNHENPSFKYSREANEDDEILNQDMHLHVQKAQTLSIRKHELHYPFLYIVLCFPY